MNSTGPRESSLMRIAMTNIRGDSTIKKEVARSTSKPRLHQKYTRRFVLPLTSTAWTGNAAAAVVKTCPLAITEGKPIVRIRDWICGMMLEVESYLPAEGKP